MSVLSVYPKTKRAYLRAAIGTAFGALTLAGCSIPINPNFHTIVWRDAKDYAIEGSLTRGFASRPKVAYIQAEGNSPDNGSFETLGANAGITPQGIYIPTALIKVDANGRFNMKVVSTRRFVLVRLFAWDDLNGDSRRDTNEQLANEFNLKKEDQRGWTFNAPDWNQFNFVFNQ